MTNPTTPAEAVAQWCEANGWTKNPEFIPADTRYVRIHDGEVAFDGAVESGIRDADWPQRQVVYADLPKPVLPTEPGSLIVDATDIEGDHYSHLQLDDSRWAGRTDDGEWLYIAPEHIVSWHPGKAVRAEGENNG